MITTLVYRVHDRGYPVHPLHRLSLTFGSMRIVNFAHALVYTTGAYFLVVALRTLGLGFLRRRRSRRSRPSHRGGDRAVHHPQALRGVAGLRDHRNVRRLLIGVDLIKVGLRSDAHPALGSDRQGRGPVRHLLSPLPPADHRAGDLDPRRPLPLLQKDDRGEESWWRGWRTRTRCAASASTSTGIRDRLSRRQRPGGARRVLYAPITSVHPYMGFQVLLICFAVVIVGGMGSLHGTFLASFALGMVNRHHREILGARGRKRWSISLFFLLLFPVWFFCFCLGGKGRGDLGGGEPPFFGFFSGPRGPQYLPGDGDHPSKVGRRRGTGPVEAAHPPHDDDSEADQEDLETHVRVAPR